MLLTNGKGKKAPRRSEGISTKKIPIKLKTKLKIVI